MIAETLYKNKIPYRYEWPLSLKNENKSTVIFHPDFYCFNVNTRKEYVWEHFGKLDEEKYLLEVVKKLNLYLMKENLKFLQKLRKQEKQKKFWI